MPRGGYRKGAGRPPAEHPAKRRCFRMNDPDWEELLRRAEEAKMNATDYIKSKTIGGD